MTEGQPTGDSGEEQPKGQRPPPRCKAILLCDQVIVEAGTGRASIIGTLDRFMLPRYPGRMQPFQAFLHLLNGIGRYDIVVELHDLKENRVLGRGVGIGLEFKDRLQRMNVVIPIPPLPLPHPGVYDIVVFANGQEIDRQQFEAVAPKEPQQ